MSLPSNQSLHARVMESAALYDVVQRLAGIEKLRRRLSPVLAALAPGTLLDVGAGTGAFYDLLPAHVEYLPLDVDPSKLARLREKHGVEKSILASGASLPLDDSSVDYTLCTNVAHHLPERDLNALLSELARVTTRQLVFVDPLRVDALKSRLLWRIDRGAHPRRHDQLAAKLTASFSTRELETFSYIHTYLLFVGTPKARADV